MSDPDHPLLTDTTPLVPMNAVAALIVDGGGRYLMQLRDRKRGIWYPDHWGLFGGAVEPGEDPLAALYRELEEELTFRPKEVRYFNRLDMHFDPFGAEPCWRIFYEVRVTDIEVAGMSLREGRSVEAVGADELLLERRCVPYDAFAVWMHVAREARGRRGSGAD